MAEGTDKITADKMESKFKFNSVLESKIPPFTDHFRFSEGLSRCEPGGFVMTEEFARHAHEFVNFKPRKDDAWVVTFPKCGN